MKTYAKPILLLIGVFLSASAKTALAQEANQDSAIYTKVMIVPFEERMYFSDSDKTISDKSKMSIAKVRRTFRASLVETLERDLTKVYGGTYAVDPDSVENKQSDIARIYRGISYKPEKRKPEKEEKPINEVAIDKFNSILKKKEDKDDEAMRHSGMNSLLDKNGFYDYMNISIDDVSTLQAMKEETGSDLFLFINQFEIKTNYRTCIDAASGLYERNFIVHYSVFNSKGEQLAGDMLVFPYHNNESRIKMMVYHKFGEISATIIGNMPMPYKIMQQQQGEDEGDNEGEMPLNVGDMIRRD